MGLLKTTFICWIFSKRCSCFWQASCSSRSLWAARVYTQTTQSISSLDLWCWDTRLHQLLEHLLPDPIPYVQIFDSWIRSKFMDNLPETWEYFVIKQVGLPSSPLNQPLESSHKFPLRPSEDPFFYSRSQPSILAAGMRGPPAASFWLQNVAGLCIFFSSSSDTSSKSPAEQKHTPNVGMSIPKTKSKADPEPIE